MNTKTHLDVFTPDVNFPVVPLMSRDAFAKAIGIPVGVVTGWADRGYIPCVSIGKYSLVNLELLRKQCANKEFSI
ncbi:hypothetical protein [Undibacterium sp. SXout20W]|uniref:hypothetical protein n=1 Tax=Undibacterium sp. SXout20W TaxID=3413051 RepID=UPI003BF4054B